MDKRYQVFLSSTYADLKDERRAVIHALMEMDCIPAGMELFPAADEDQFQFIKKVIDDCDYYILIIGGRYGSTTSEGLSYTENEYDYAREKKIKVLAFVHENPGKIALEKSEIDLTLRARLDAFREKVKAGSIVKMWQDAKDLPGLVALSLLKTIKTYPAVGWVRADQVANSEALRDLNTLRKRNEELEKRLNDVIPSLPSLAGLDDVYTLSGTSKNDGYASSYQWHFSLLWSDIFASLAPYVMENPNDAIMHSRFESVIRDIQKKKQKSTLNNWTIDAQDYQTVKIQFMALKLVKVEMASTVDGGQALFWFLTPLGQSTLMQLRAIKQKD